MQITSFSLPLYSTLTFTHVIEYDRRPHNDTQTELYEQEVIQWNRMQNKQYNTKSQVYQVQTRQITGYYLSDDLRGH